MNTDLKIEPILNARRPLAIFFCQWQHTSTWA
jgi:hypothetical protein